MLRESDTWAWQISFAFVSFLGLAMAGCFFTR